MKTFLILILSAALGAAAFFTRPSEADFQEWVASRLPRDQRSLPERIFGLPSTAERYLHGLVFRDRYLWVQVENAEGQIVFTGAFDHWFDRSRVVVAHRQSAKAGQDTGIMFAEQPAAK